MDLRILICALAFASLCSQETHAQEDVAIPRSKHIRHGRDAQATAAIRTEVKLVLVPISVTDPYQRPVLDLQPENFRVFDDGTEQKISKLSLEDAPISVGMVFDSSDSMRNKLANSRRALA